MTYSYQPGQFNQIYSPDTNEESTFDFTNQGMANTGSMIDQQNRVDIETADADWKFAGSVLEKLAPFIKQKAEDNMKKRFADGLDAYNAVPAAAKERARKSFMENEAELVSSAQVLDDQADAYWEKNKNKYMSMEIAEQFRVQGFGKAYGFAKGWAIDQANAYNLEQPQITKATDGTDFTAAMSVERRKLHETLGDINHGLYATHVEPIIRAKENAAYKSWHKTHAAEVLLERKKESLKAFKHSIAAENPETVGLSVENFIRANKIHFGGSIPATKGYFTDVFNYGISTGEINEKQVNMVEKAKMKNWTDGSDTTAEKILGKDSFTTFRKTLKARKKKVYEDTKDDEKIASFDSESSQLDRLKSGPNNEPPEIEPTVLNIKKLISEHGESHSHRPTRLHEELAQAELVEEIGWEEIEAHYQRLYDSDKLTVEDIQNALPRIRDSEEWQKKAKASDKTWKEDKKMTDKYKGWAANKWGKNQINAHPDAKRFDDVIIQHAIAQLKLEREGAVLKEKETIEDFNKRTRENVEEDIDKYLTDVFKRGVSVRGAMDVLEGKKPTSIKTQVNAEERVGRKKIQIDFYLNEGKADVSSWPPGGLYGPDHNGVISRQRLVENLTKNSTKPGGGGVFSKGKNIGGRLKVGGNFHKDPLIQLIAKETKDTYWGALNKLAVAFDETPIKLPPSIEVAESLPAEQLDEIKKGMEYSNPYAIERGFGVGYQNTEESDVNFATGWNAKLSEYGDEITKAGLENNQPPGLIGAWTEVLEENPSMMKDVWSDKFMQEIHVDVMRKKFKLDGDINALNATTLFGINK